MKTLDQLGLMRNLLTKCQIRKKSKIIIIIKLSECTLLLYLHFESNFTLLKFLANYIKS